MGAQVKGEGQEGAEDTAYGEKIQGGSLGPVSCDTPGQGVLTAVYIRISRGASKKSRFLFPTSLSPRSQGGPRNLGFEKALQMPLLSSQG